MRTTNTIPTCSTCTIRLTPSGSRASPKPWGHPTRIAILRFLAERSECYFGDIHEELPIAKATVSQHLAELKEAGLIQGTIEPPKVKYCINRENWKIAGALFAGMFAGCRTENRTGCCDD